MPRARPISKLPFIVSSDIAVVMTRVAPLMLPPTMRVIPVSPTTRENPVIMAATKAKRPWRRTVPSIRPRDAPREYARSRPSRAGPWSAASVRAVTIGKASSAWARIIAPGVNSSPRKPNSPRRLTRM